MNALENHILANQKKKKKNEKRDKILLVRYLRLDVSIKSVYRIRRVSL